MQCQIVEGSLVASGELRAIQVKKDLSLSVVLIDSRCVPFSSAGGLLVAAMVSLGTFKFVTALLQARLEFWEESPLPLHRTALVVRRMTSFN